MQVVTRSGAPDIVIASFAGNPDDYEAMVPQVAEMPCAQSILPQEICSVGGEDTRGNVMLADFWQKGSAHSFTDILLPILNQRPAGKVFWFAPRYFATKLDLSENLAQQLISGHYLLFASLKEFSRAIEWLERNQPSDAECVFVAVGKPRHFSHCFVGLFTNLLSADSFAHRLAPYSKGRPSLFQVFTRFPEP